MQIVYKNFILYFIEIIYNKDNINDITNSIGIEIIKDKIISDSQLI